LNGHTIPRGHQIKCRTYNSGRTVKYGLLLKMLCEKRKCCISEMDNYSAESNDSTVRQVAETILNKKTIICSIIITSRGLPSDLLRKRI
jgi:hypothetical protein